MRHKDRRNEILPKLREKTDVENNREAERLPDGHRGMAEPIERITENGEQRMTREAYLEMTAKGIVLLDGATGSCLRSRGMPAGVCTEEWIYEHPEVISGLQKEYADAGSQIIYAPKLARICWRRRRFCLWTRLW